jgi:hypothetical protein
LLMEKSCSSDLTYGIGILLFREFNPEEFLINIISPQTTHSCCKHWDYCFASLDVSNGVEVWAVVFRICHLTL